MQLMLLDEFKILLSLSIVYISDFIRKFSQVQAEVKKKYDNVSSFSKFF